MITDAVQLEAAIRQLNGFHEMLEAMRVHLQETNPALFPALSEGYLKHIVQLEQEIIDYVHHLATEMNSVAEIPEANRTDSPAIEIR